MTESVTESVTEKFSDFAQNLVRWGSDSIKLLKFWTFRIPIFPIGKNSDLVSEFKIPIASRPFFHGVRPKYKRFRLKKKLAQKPPARTPICLPPPRSELCPLHFFILDILYKLWGRILLELYLSSHYQPHPTILFVTSLQITREHFYSIERFYLLSQKIKYRIQ